MSRKMIGGALQFSLASISLLFCQIAVANNFISHDRQWVLGDWNGKRQQLQNQGYNFNTSIVTEAATNLDGGYNNDLTFKNAGQLTLGASFDFSKIAGWKDTTAALTLTKRKGNALTVDRIKDPRTTTLGNSQEIVGRGEIWRLTQAWIKTGVFDNTLQFKIGRMGASEDFNASHCEFQSLLLCGGQLGKSIGSIWFNGPVSVWAANVKYHFAPEWTVGLGIYEINQDNAKTLSDRDGFNLDMNNVDGALIPLELIWKPQLSVFNNLSGEYKIGAVYSTADAKNIANSQMHDSKHSFWINAQQQLTQHNIDSKRGLFMSVNGVINDKATTAVHSTQQVAFWYKGLLNNRPNDSIGLGFANYSVNERLTNLQKQLNEIRGYEQYDPLVQDYTPIQHDELNIELNYTYQWSPAITLRPNLQYIYQPSGVKEVDNAWVAGLTLKLNL